MKRLMDDPGLPLHEFSRNIIIVEDPITNNISSTVLREQVVQVMLRFPPAECEEKGLCLCSGVALC